MTSGASDPSRYWMPPPSLESQSSEEGRYPSLPAMALGPACLATHHQSPNGAGAAALTIF